MNRLQVGSGSLRPLVRRLVVPALFVATLFAVVIWRRPSPTPGPQVVTFSGPTMGTAYTVKVVVAEPLAEGERQALSDVTESALAAVDRAMSTWRDDSELSRFNRAGTEPFAASPALGRVMVAALDVFRRSGGAFDVTVGPLVDAWGFGRQTPVELPSAEEVARLLALTGSEHLQLDEAAGTLRKELPGLRCDLSAIAKGYAVDQVAAALNGVGRRSFMVEVGGEVVARGKNADGQSWRIGIESPDAESPAVYTAVALADAALATSGDYRSFRLDDGGERLSHILDPRTGRPASHGLASVSVIASSCMIADAWATALTVLGPEEGLEVAEREDLAVLLLSRRADGSLVETQSRALRRYFAAHPLEESR